MLMAFPAGDSVDVGDIIFPVGADVPAPACAFSGILCSVPFTGPSSAPEAPAALVRLPLVLSPLDKDLVDFSLEAGLVAFDLIADEAEV